MLTQANYSELLTELMSQWSGKTDEMNKAIENGEFTALDSINREANELHAAYNVVRRLARDARDTKIEATSPTQDSAN